MHGYHDYSQSVLSAFTITVTLLLLLHTGFRYWQPESHLFVFLNGRRVTQADEIGSGLLHVLF